MTTGLAVRLFDLPTEPTTHGDEVADKYPPGFKLVGVRKERIPRSDIKSIALSLGNNAVYIQPKWKLLRDGI